MFNRMHQQKQKKIQNKTKRSAFNQEGFTTFSKPCLLILQWVNAYSLYDISMEVALVFNGAKDTISLAITKLNIDMHHV